MPVKLLTSTEKAMVHVTRHGVTGRAISVIFTNRSGQEVTVPVSDWDDIETWVRTQTSLIKESRPESESETALNKVNEHSKDTEANSDVK